MKEEKILSFLNIDKRAKNKKFLEKTCMWLSIGFTILVGGILLLSGISRMNISFAISFVIVDFLIALTIILNKNPAISYIITAIILALIIAKFLIGYVIISNVEYVEDGIPRFTWIHLAIIIISFWFSLYMCMILYRNYKIIQHYPLQEATKKIKDKYYVPKWFPIVSVVVSCPMVFVRLLKDDLSVLGLRIGFSFVLLACASAMMLSACLFKCIVIIRFKAYKFFR